MILYSWFRSGYISDRPMEFKDLMDVCFEDTLLFCQEMECKSHAFVKCSHCSTNFMLRPLFYKFSFSF